MARRSTTSWLRAPKIAGIAPVAATSMSTTDRAMPSQMLCSATCMVRRPIRTAVAVLARSSVRITTSADSLAAVAPRAPIATPTSAAASTGASLTPSPTMSTGRCGALRTVRTLSSGRHSGSTRVMPSAAATCSTVARASPLSTRISRTPSAVSSAIVAAASSRTWSLITRVPAKRPSTAT